MRREKLVKSVNKQGGNVEDNHRDYKHPTPSGVGFVTFLVTRIANPMANANTQQITCTAAMLSMIKLIGLPLRRDQNVDAEISPPGHV